jgi:hypothetical protein
MQWGDRSHKSKDDISARGHNSDGSSWGGRHLVAVGTSTVHELLLGEREELASGNLVGTLGGTGGGEGPTRATLALVLDGGHGTLGHPVDIGGKVGLVKDRSVVGLLEVSAVAARERQTGVRGDDAGTLDVNDDG